MSPLSSWIIAVSKSLSFASCASTINLAPSHWSSTFDVAGTTRTSDTTVLVDAHTQLHSAFVCFSCPIDELPWHLLDLNLHSVSPFAQLNKESRQHTAAWRSTTACLASSALVAASSTPSISLCQLVSLVTAFRYPTLHFRQLLFFLRSMNVNTVHFKADPAMHREPSDVPHHASSVRILR